MNPAELAMLEAWTKIKGDIERRKVIKEIAEISEDFSDKKKKVKFKDETFSVITSNKIDFANLQEVDGGFIMKDIILLEDGYIQNRVLFERGSVQAGFETWIKQRPSLIVNNSHIDLEDDWMNGMIGSIINMRSEAFGEAKEGQSKYRIFADIFLDARNPVNQWLVAFGNSMNQLLRSRGEDGNVFSASAEVRFKDFDFVEFAGSFVPSVEAVTFEGMGIVFNPASVTSFGTVDSFRNSRQKGNSIYTIPVELKKSPFYLLEKSDMDEKQKAMLEELRNKAELTSEDRLKVLELTNLESEVKEEAGETPEGEEPKVAPVEEPKKEEETPKEEEKPEGEETPAEPKEEDKPEVVVPAVEPKEEEESVEKAAFKELQVRYSEQVATLSNQITTANEQLAVAGEQLDKALSLAEIAQKKQSKLEKRLEVFSKALDSAKVAPLSRVPAQPDSTPKLSRAQKRGRHGKGGKH